jgi:IS30 family transposase
MGKGQKSALLVIVDRATLKITIDKLKSKNAKLVATKILARIKKMPPIRTITFDNDQAFSLHELIAKKTKAKTFFTRPYSSQDKGTIENRNGVIRMFFPKKTDFLSIPVSKIKQAEREMNRRPIRKFGYLSANELFSSMKGSVALMS